MITIIRTSTLRAMRAAAEGLAEELDIAAAQYAAEVHRGDRLETALNEAIRAQSGRLARILAAAHDPVTGPGIQGAIALRVVRDIIAEAKASGDPAAIEGVRVMDALLGEDLPFSGSGTRPAASLSTGQLRDGASHQDAGANR